MTKDVFNQLQKISVQQSKIKSVKSRLSVYQDVANKHAETFAELQLVKRVPVAYRHCLAECMRRFAFRLAGIAFRPQQVALQPGGIAFWPQHVAFCPGDAALWSLFAVFLPGGVAFRPHMSPFGLELLPFGALKPPSGLAAFLSGPPKSWCGARKAPQQLL